MASVFSSILYAVHLGVKKTFKSSFNITKFVCQSSWNLSKLAFSKSLKVYKFSSASINIVYNTKTLAYQIKKIYDLSKSDLSSSKSSLILEKKVH